MKKISERILWQESNDLPFKTFRFILIFFMAIIMILLGIIYLIFRDISTASLFIGIGGFLLFTSLCYINAWKGFYWVTITEAGLYIKHKVLGKTFYFTPSNSIQVKLMIGDIKDWYGYKSRTYYSSIRFKFIVYTDNATYIFPLYKTFAGARKIGFKKIFPENLNYSREICELFEEGLRLIEDLFPEWIVINDIF